MSLIQHSIGIVDGAVPSNQDRTVIGLLTGVANVAGGGAGTAVTTAVSLPASANLPANYAVLVSPSQAAMCSVNSKTSTGFNVVLTPLATVTLAIGTFDVVIVA